MDWETALEYFLIQVNYFYLLTVSLELQYRPLLFKHGSMLH
jgi:hypothetical protein